MVREHGMHAKVVTCLICKKEMIWDDNPFRPFCSERCRLIDLGKWVSEEYRISGRNRDIPDLDSREKNKEEW